MLNQSIFPNQGNNMNTISLYKQMITNIIDDIIEIDLEIFQYQYLQQQMINQFFFQQNPNMMMPNMQFMQNQFMNPQQILEKRIQLYKEKYEKLTEEKNNKRSMRNIMGMGQMFPCMNNNFINPNFQINQNPMSFNNMQINNMNMNMNNNMNMMNNMFNPGIFQMDPPKMESDADLTLVFMLEGGQDIRIQCKSKDKLEIPINNFKTKVQSESDYDFFLIIEKNFNFNLTVKENELNDCCLIFARKKLNNNIQNIKIENKNNNNGNNEIKFINKLNNNHGIKYDHQGDMNLLFHSTTGLKINITIYGSQTFRDAVHKFLEKIRFYRSNALKDLAFVYNATRLNIEDNRQLREIFKGQNPKITVLDVNNILGA